MTRKAVYLKGVHVERSFSKLTKCSTTQHHVQAGSLTDSSLQALTKREATLVDWESVLSRLPSLPGLQPAGFAKRKDLEHDL